jgi:hypothetical protein
MSDAKFMFEEFPKIARLKREIVITEKLDGTNAQIALFELHDSRETDIAAADPYCLDFVPALEDGGNPLALYVGSRQRWIAPEGMIINDDQSPLKGSDNFGFARWVMENRTELAKLGPGRHYGEWYGHGIQRGYGLNGKRFALFNAARWGSHNPNTPECCEVVTRLNEGLLEKATPEDCMNYLDDFGSQHVPGWSEPEGIIVYHSASRTMFKQTFGNDGGKWQKG